MTEHFMIIKIYITTKNHYLLYTLKNNVLYWNLWFHEEPLPSMELLHCKKDCLDF